MRLCNAMSIGNFGRRTDQDGPGDDESTAGALELDCEYTFSLFVCYCWERTKEVSRGCCFHVNELNASVEWMLLRCLSDVFPFSVPSRSHYRVRNHTRKRHGTDSKTQNHKQRRPRFAVSAADALSLLSLALSAAGLCCATRTITDQSHSESCPRHHTQHQSRHHCHIHAPRRSRA